MVLWLTERTDKTTRARGESVWLTDGGRRPGSLNGYRSRFRQISQSCQYRKMMRGSMIVSFFILWSSQLWDQWLLFLMLQFLLLLFKFRIKNFHQSINLNHLVYCHLLVWFKYGVFDDVKSSELFKKWNCVGFKLWYVFCRRGTFLFLKINSEYLTGRMLMCFLCSL